MAVTVITMRNSEGGIYAKDVYENGRHLHVSATGHLSVSSPANETLGVYMPDQWRTAFKDGEAVVDAD